VLTDNVGEVVVGRVLALVEVGVVVDGQLAEVVEQLSQCAL